MMYLFVYINPAAYACLIFFTYKTERAIIAEQRGVSRP